MGPDRPQLQVDGALADALGSEREAFLAWCRARLQPGFALRSERLTTPTATLAGAARSDDRPLPLRRGLLDRIRGRPAGEPRLSSIASKFGGVPYLEAGTPWPADRRGSLAFLGQINFADVPADFAPLPSRGLLTMFLTTDVDKPLLTWWWPEPDESRAAPVDDVGPRCFGRFETVVRFTPIWSLPLIEPDPEIDLGDLQVEWISSFNERQSSGHDHLLHAQTWPNTKLPAGVVPLLQLSHDGAADFQFGSSYLFVFVPAADLREGRLDRVTSYLGQ